MQVEYKEVTLGVSTEPEIKDFLKFCDGRIEQDLKDTMHEWVSMDLEKWTVHADSLKLYKHRSELLRQEYETQDVITVRLSTKQSGETIPAKLLIGNGVTWMASIRLPWVPVFTETGAEELSAGGRPKIRMCLVNLSRSDEIFEVLSMMSAVVGVGIIRDCQEFSQFLQNTWGVTISMPRQVELGALFISCGGSFPKHSLVFLNYICTGGMMNKLCSEADNKWYLPLSYLPEELVIYAIDDLRAGFITGVVLFAILTRQTFADPSVACLMMGCDQKEWCNYASNMFVYALNGVAIHRPSYMRHCQTRSEQIDNLRPEEVADDNQEEKLSTLKGILSTPFPTLPYGGHRVMHQTRTFFKVYQFPQIISLNTPTNLNFVYCHADDEDKEVIDSYILFGRYLAHDQLVIQPPVFSKGLLPHPVAYVRVVEFHSSLRRRQEILQEEGVEILDPYVLDRHAKKSKITVSEMIYELCCIFPTDVRMIVNWLATLDTNSEEFKWYAQRSDLYLRLRELHVFLTCHQTSEAVNMKAIAAGKVSSAIATELNARSSLRREARLACAVNRNLARSNINLHQRLYKLVPGERTKENFLFRQRKKLGKGKAGDVPRKGVVSKRAQSVHSRLGNKSSGIECYL